MHPIFYGFGPVFRRNLLAEPFRTVDIYPLMSHILQLNERKTNGSFDNVKHILLKSNPFEDILSNLGFISKYILPSKSFEHLSADFLALGCLISVIILGIIYTIGACRHCRDLIYVERPVRYRLLSNNEVSANNFLASESEEEIH